MDNDVKIKIDAGNHQVRKLLMDERAAKVNQTICILGKKAIVKTHGKGQQIGKM